MCDPWAEYVKKYSVHEESRLLTDTLAANGIKSFHEYTREDARQILPVAFKAAAGEVTFDGTVQELAIPSPYDAAGIPVSVYKPRSCVPKPAIWVYFHGGGLSILNRACYDSALKCIAMQAGCIIVSVEYRLLPDQGEAHAPFNDAVISTKWVQKNKEALGGHTHSKVGVGGDSAGGQISATMTNDVTGLDFQVLLCGSVDMALNTPSVEEFVNVPVLSKPDLMWFMDSIRKANPDYLTDVRFNPMLRTNTEQSPPALILQAQLDTLRDSGLLYGEKLKAAGVRVRTVVVEGVPHCFFVFPAIFKTKSQEAFGHITNFIKEFQ